MLDSTSILVFCRLMGFFVIAPFWSQNEVPPTVKGIIMLAIACAVGPLVPPLEVEPASIATWIIPMSMEAGIGFFFGLMGRMMLNVLDAVGNIISFQMGLSFSTIVNPALQAQTTLPSHLLMQCGIIVMLALNMHHIFLRGVVDSYHIKFSMQDCGQHLVDAMQAFFTAAIRLSMPFLVLHIFLQVTLGLLNRFVPSFSFFAISVPIQLWSGLIVLLATCVALLSEFPELLRLMWPNY